MGSLTKVSVLQHLLKPELLFRVLSLIAHTNAVATDLVISFYNIVAFSLALVEH